MINELKTRFCLIDPKLTNNEVRGLIIKRFMFGKKLVDRINILDKDLLFEDRILIAATMLSREILNYSISIDYTYKKELILIENFIGQLR
ncbi:MAG: hypothetical protein ACRCX8_02965 [Sarcina sp.]